MTFTHCNYLGDIELTKRKHQVVDFINSQMAIGFLRSLALLVSITEKFSPNGGRKLVLRRPIGSRRKQPHVVRITMKRPKRT